MAVNPLGLIAGATAFFSIWLGHVSVRKLEARTARLWQPMLVFLILGLAMELGAALTTNRALSLVLGITGFSLLWDVLELKRQEKRVRRGHAPANPDNPRHVALTTGDISKDIQTGVQNFEFPQDNSILSAPETSIDRKHA